eukprot:gene3492-16328_t
MADSPLDTFSLPLETYAQSRQEMYSPIQHLNDTGKSISEPTLDSRVSSVVPAADARARRNSRSVVLDNDPIFFTTDRRAVSSIAPGDRAFSPYPIIPPVEQGTGDRLADSYFSMTASELPLGLLSNGQPAPNAREHGNAAAFHPSQRRHQHQHQHRAGASAPENGAHSANQLYSPSRSHPSVAQSRATYTFSDQHSPASTNKKKKKKKKKTTSKEKEKKKAYFNTDAGHATAQTPRGLESRAWSVDGSVASGAAAASGVTDVVQRPTVDLATLLNPIPPDIGNAAIFASAAAPATAHFFGDGDGGGSLAPSASVSDADYQARMRLLDGGGSTGGVPALMIWQLADGVVDEALAESVLATVVRAAKTEMVEEYMFRLSNSAEDNAAADLLDEVLHELATSSVRQTVSEMVQELLLGDKANDFLIAEVDVVVQQLVGVSITEDANEAAADMILNLAVDVIAAEVADVCLDAGHQIIADKQHREMESFAQTKFLQQAMLERLVQHLATNAEPILKNQYAERVLDSVLLSMLIHKSSEVRVLQDETLQNDPLQSIHRRLVMHQTLNVLADEIKEQMTASLDVLHAQEQQQREKDDFVYSVEGDLIPEGTSREEWVLEMRDWVMNDVVENASKVPAAEVVAQVTPTPQPDQPQVHVQASLKDADQLGQQQQQQQQQQEQQEVERQIERTQQERQQRLLPVKARPLPLPLPAPSAPPTPPEALEAVNSMSSGGAAFAAGGSGGDSEGDDDVFLEATSPAELPTDETGEGHSAADLPHISDREDHALHEIAVKSTIIIERGSVPSSPATPIRRASSTISPQRRMSHMPGENGENGLRRSNSTSTLFVDSTQESPETYPSKFDEKTFPLTEARVPASYATDVPPDETIYDFMNRLFHAAALTAECGIITIVYINRVIQYTGLALHASNWKRVLLGAILMASKVWDDQAVWNVDFCSILPKIEVEDMNDLERTYLEMLQFNINVDSSVYTMYYFQLRSLAEEAQRPFPLEPMTRSQAAKLEATAKHVAEGAVKEGSMRGSKSMGHKDFPTRAVLP